MDCFLRELRNQAVGSMQGANIRFFVPTEAFFTALSPYRGKVFVDAGCGTGEVSREARARHFQMIPVDLMERDGQWEEVLHMEAESMIYSPSTWLLMCRPDHSGWAFETLEIALKRGAGALYAGLPRNLERDLEDYVGREARRWTKVGEDGEELLLFLPEALLIRSKTDALVQSRSA